jgi:hypothetical protein
MADIPLGPWLTGMDNVSPDASRDPGAPVDAVNVVFDKAGGAMRRRGFSLLNAGPGWHSLWTSPKGRTFCVHLDQLCSVSFDGAMTATPLYTLAAKTPLSYTEINGDVICTNPSEILRIDLDNVVSRLGMARPAPPAVSAVDYGGLDAGRYAVAISPMRWDEEGPLSYAAFVDVPQDGGIRVTVPGVEAGYRIYRTQANGEQLHAVSGATPGATHSLGAQPIGRAADSIYLESLPPGSIVRHWRGLALVARGRIIFWSEPMRYGLYDPRHNFVQMAHTVTLMEPVEGGVYVGDRDGVKFLAGPSPKEWAVKAKSGVTPVAGTGTTIQGSILGGDLATDERVAVWLSEKGFMVGTASGQIAEVQAKRIRLPDEQVEAGVGAVVVHDRQIIASIN